MTDKPSDTTMLQEELLAALDLLKEHGSDGVAALTEDGQSALPSLLEKCEALCAEAEAETVDPIRSLHHFACTGGTLISKCVGALPNTVLLSEIDPLSTLHLRHPKPPFFPTDILAGLVHNPRVSDPDMVVDVFLAGVERMIERLQDRGQHLVLRDHAHSHFCFGPDVPQRPTLHEMLAQLGTTRAVVTVRHPLDSYLSLSKQDWRHFSPFSLAEYCQRYEMFLDRYADTPVFKYEDFVTDPQAILSQIADALELSYSPVALDGAAALRLSGDSGRGGAKISQRARRDIPDDVKDELKKTPQYKKLCNRMGYTP